MEGSRNHAWIYEVKKRFCRKIDESGVSLYRITEGINDKGRFYIRYNTLRYAVDLSTDALNLTVLASVCDYMGWNMNDICFGETSRGLSGTVSFTDSNGDRRVYSISGEKI